MAVKTPLQIADEMLARPGLPKSNDGRGLAPINADSVRQLIIQAINLDRNQPDGVDDEEVANTILEGSPKPPEQNTWCRIRIMDALSYARAQGARFAEPTLPLKSE